jgi:nucleotide-binding universal stress UspA family protein
MIDITRILWPVDFSEYSRHALHHAVAVARWYGATITALHVHSAFRVVGNVAESAMIDYDVLTPAEQQRLASEVRRFVDQNGPQDVPVDVVVETGDTARRILETAAGMPADLVVMGTHGRSGFVRLVLGSVTEKVLRQAACPVMSVPRGTPDATPTPPLFKRILCPIDFSDCSLHALRYAMSLAQEADARLIALHVTEFPPASTELVPVPLVDLDEYRKQYEQESRERLEQAIPETVRAYCHVDTRVTAGSPYREILHLAAEQQVDLIVMGVRGSGGLDRLFFGSTTNHVVRQASCPVLTLRLP